MQLTFTGPKRAEPMLSKVSDTGIAWVWFMKIPLGSLCVFFVFCFGLTLCSMPSSALARPQYKWHLNLKGIMIGHSSVRDKRGDIVYCCLPS